MKEDSLLWG